MSNFSQTRSSRTHNKCLSILAAAIAPCIGLTAMPHASHAATQDWLPATAGDIGVAANYNTGSTVPSNGDSFTADGAFTITYGSSEPFTSLGTVNLNVTSGAGIFNQTGGTLGITTLVMGGSGASRHPIYSLTGNAVLNATTITFGSGTGTAINLGSGTTVNYTGGLTLGTAGSASAAINVMGGTFNDSGTALTLGSSASATGTINVSGGVFNANSVTTLYVANSGGASTAGNIILGNNGTFNANAATVILGQYGSTSSATNPATASLTLSGTSTFNAGESCWGALTL